MGLRVTMIVFVITLKDRYADILVLASFLIGSALNLPRFHPSAVEKAGARAWPLGSLTCLRLQPNMSAT